MITKIQIIDALAPLFDLFGADPSNEKWDQYAAALEDVNAGDLDDAITEIRRTHSFRNAPLPAEILARVQVARRRRIVAAVEAERPDPVIAAGEGTLREHTIEGVGTLRLRVLPDDHPALQRFSCTNCLDTGWAEGPTTPQGHASVQRCFCFAHNPVLQRDRVWRSGYNQNRKNKKSRADGE
jgi:hypothetical protein